MATGPTSPPPMPWPLATHLAELTRCREQGSISEEEYRQMKQRLCDFFLHSASGYSGPTGQVSLGASMPGRPRQPRAAWSRHDSFGNMRNDSLGNLRSSTDPLTDRASSTALDCFTNEAPAEPDEGSPQKVRSRFIDRGEPKFWKGYIEKKTVEAKPLDPATVNDVYDVTAERLHDLFDRVDLDNDGTVSIEELHALLLSQGFNISQKGALEIADHVYKRWGVGDWSPDSRTIGRNHFEMMVKRLRLAELFTPDSGSVQWDAYEKTYCHMFVCDFNTVEAQVEVVAEDVQEDFFFGHQRLLSKGANGTRWVHVDATKGLDRLLMLRLGVKYHLHPLAIGDIFSNRTTSKMDKYAENYFISMDIIALAEEEQTNASKRQAFKARSGSQLVAVPPRVRIHRSHVSISLSGTCETILTIHQERPDESSWLSMWRTSNEDNLQDGQSAVAYSGKAMSMWRKLESDLCENPPRRMREEDADFLAYEILARVVQEVRPVVEAYALRLGFFRQQPAGCFKPAWLQELSDVQVELLDLTRSVRPMRSVVRRIVDAPIADSAKVYLEDVNDLIGACEEDLTQLSQMARSLEEAQERHSDKRMNDILFSLSIITAIFLPAQFWTGVYGMNFEPMSQEELDERLHTWIMPELGWQYGYICFWIVALCSSLLMMVVLGIRTAAISWSFRCGCCARRSSSRSYRQVHDDSSTDAEESEKSASVAE